LEKGKTMVKPQIVRDAERVARMVFVGIAIPCNVSAVDGGVIQGEKILKFNRKALQRIGKRKADKVSGRYRGGEDTMILPVGKPGSRERVEALALQYAAAQSQEISPFSWEG
jgi:hypothetical protein